jgi:hypothetical protein
VPSTVSPVPSVTLTPRVPGPEPALARTAADAKASRRVLDVVDAATVADCRDLGQSSAESEIAGVNGRAYIRALLRTAAVNRGASHLLFSEFQAGISQSETAKFYNCTAPRIAVGSEPGSSLVSSEGAVAIQFDLVPAGSLSLGSTFGRETVNVDTATTYGISGSFDRFVTPFLAVGFAPGVIFGQGEDAMDSATQLDMRARVRLGWLARDGLAAAAYGTAGASWIFFPKKVTSFGGTLGFGVAANYSISGSSFITIEAGYQLGAQSTTVDDVDIDASSNLFHLGIGLGSYL